MSYLELSLSLFNGAFGEYAIRSTLRRNGFSRYVAYRKANPSEKTGQKPLAFAHEHANWTSAEWAYIRLTYETCISGMHRGKTWVSRRKGEELEETWTI